MIHVENVNNIVHQKSQIFINYFKIRKNIKFTFNSPDLFVPAKNPDTAGKNIPKPHQKLLHHSSKDLKFLNILWLMATPKKNV